MDAAFTVGKSVNLQQANVVWGLAFFLQCCRYGLELAALGDGDGELGLAVGTHGHALHLAKQQQRRRVQYLAKHHVLAVQPVARRAREEKLAAIRVLPAVGLPPNDATNKLG